jgi:hypothetical protein
MPPPNLKLKRLQAIAKHYNAQLQKPIKLAQKKANLRNDLLTRKVSLYSKTDQLKNMVRRANTKATKLARAKQKAEKKKNNKIVANAGVTSKKKKRIAPVLVSPLAGAGAGASASASGGTIGQKNFKKKMSKMEKAYEKLHGKDANKNLAF